MLVVTQILSIIAGAFISEDLTLIAVALLIRNSQIAWPIGILGAFLGIFVGDVYLWAVGHFVGRRALAFAWVARRLPCERITTAGQWFERHGLKAMIASRFLPGTRLPMYVASGILGKNALRVISWTFLAAFIWTPLFVGAIYLLGDTFIEPFRRLFGSTWVTLALFALLPYAAVQVWPCILTREARRKTLLPFRRLVHREFWPSWLFYLPIVPYLLCLAIRHRSLTAFTAANPAIPMGGIIDESKSDILSHLPREWTLDFALIAAGETEARVASLDAILAAKNWSFPLIFKPDNGYRGSSVKLIRTAEAARAYFIANPLPTLVQVYHCGPHEAGIFYYRLPGESRGHILSISDKHFPVLTGDGIRTIEELIWQHPRYSLQARTFLARHKHVRTTVLAKGQIFPLALAGNHCQGTLFKDGAHLITQALEARIDAIARHYAGFFFGRFDVRYTDPASFRAGTDLAIVELNGVSSESTNMYDPEMPLLRSYSYLARTWRLAFQIGAINAQRGAPTSSLRQILAALRLHQNHAPPNPLSD